MGAIGAALICVALLAACAPKMVHKSPTASFNFTEAQKRILIIEPDVQLGELTASGLVEIRADWTSSARASIVSSIQEILSQRKIDVVNVESLRNHRQIQIAKLNSVVGLAILQHVYMGQKLPNKASAFDWTLGPGVNEIRNSYGADYALFLYVRDSYSTSGRVAMMVGAALLGIGVPGGQQSAFASLVDLRTGDIVWFNLLQRPTGDLRTAEPAKKTVANLIKELPL